MEGARQRRRRDRRDPQPPPMRLTERDRAIVRAVHACRVLRQDQLQALFFGSASAAQRRLALLYHHGFLARQFLAVRGGVLTSPTLYLLDRRGEELLRAGGGLDETPWNRSHNQVSHDFLEHTLAINDFRVAVTLACARDSDVALVEWRGEAALKADYDRVALRGADGGLRQVAVVPDSYLVLRTPYGQLHCLLELDRGTMTTKRFRTKVEAYGAYFRSGGYERRYGTRSLRVLTVTLSAGRLAHLKAVTEAAGERDWFWFAVLGELTGETVLGGAVWQVAGWEGRAALLVAG